MRCFGKICCLLSFSCFLFCAFVTPKEEKYVGYFLHLYSAKLFGEKNFTLHDAKAMIGKDYVHQIEMNFSCYKLLPLKLARELIVEVASDLLDKINNDPGLKEKGLIRGKFLANQLRLKISCDNMWGNTYDVTYIQEIFLDRGRITYTSYKTVPQFWGKYFTTHEEFEYALMLTGHTRPAAIAIEESNTTPITRRGPVGGVDISGLPLKDREELLRDDSKSKNWPPVITKSISLEDIDLLSQPATTVPPIEAPLPVVQKEVLPPPKEEGSIVPAQEEKQEEKPVEPSPPEPVHELPVEAAPEENQLEEHKENEAPAALLPPVEVPTEAEPQEKAIEHKEELLPETEKAAPEVPAPVEATPEHKEELLPPAVIEHKEEELPAAPTPTQTNPEAEKSEAAAPSTPAEEPRVLLPIEPETQPQAQVAHEPPKAASQPPVSAEEGKEGMLRDDSAAEGFFEQPEPVEPQVEKSAAPSANSVLEPEAQKIDAQKVVQQNLADLQRATALHESLFAKEASGITEEHVAVEDVPEPKLAEAESIIAVADQQESMQTDQLPKDPVQEKTIQENLPSQESTSPESVQEEHNREAPASEEPVKEVMIPKEAIQERPIQEISIQDEPVTPPPAPPQPVKIAQKMPHMALGNAHDLPEPQQDTDQFIALSASDKTRDSVPVIHREIAATERLKKAEEQAHEAFFTETANEEPLPPVTSDLATAEEDDGDRFFEEMGF